jgi:hypothetical protein
MKSTLPWLTQKRNRGKGKRKNPGAEAGPPGGGDGDDKRLKIRIAKLCNSIDASFCGSTAESSSYFLLDPAIKSEDDR